ncbi:TRAP transporter substrate-binding protein [Neolewinella persica]|uniref:TRAP transporter substrate-binding protein n=1 Tax=Neolewinella persica TaxID=70998 RepID=UPI001FE1F422|nr:TRAP transporter substrate-binding protein [Neolewinella persica]
MTRIKIDHLLADKNTVVVPSLLPLTYPAPAAAPTTYVPFRAPGWLLLFGLLFAFSGCATNDGVQTLRLAHTLDPTHPVHAGLVRMGEALDSISGGKMQIKIYSSGQLGSEKQCLELLQLGSLAMTKVSAAVMENFTPAYGVLSLPYLFTDRENSFRVLDGEVGQEILSQGAEVRLRGLTFFDSGTRCFYTKDGPVRTPADLVGKKVRVMNSATAVNMVKTLGGSPTPISYGELYTALQQGVVDAAENNLPSYYTSRHYEVTPFYSYDEHTSIPDVIIIGTATWDALDDQGRTWLREAAAVGTDYQRSIWRAAELEAVATLEKEGVTFTKVDGAAFREAVKPMYVTARKHPVLGPLLDRIQAQQSE